MSDIRNQKSDDLGPIPDPILSLLAQAMAEEPTEVFTSARDVIRKNRGTQKNE